MKKNLRNLKWENKSKYLIILIKYIKFEEKRKQINTNVLNELQQ